MGERPQTINLVIRGVVFAESIIPTVANDVVRALRLPVCRCGEPYRPLDYISRLVTKGGLIAYGHTGCGLSNGTFLGVVGYRGNMRRRPVVWH